MQHSYNVGYIWSSALLNLGERSATSEPDIGMLGDPSYSESATWQTKCRVAKRSGAISS